MNTTTPTTPTTTDPVATIVAEIQAIARGATLEFSVWDMGETVAYAVHSPPPVPHPWQAVGILWTHRRVAHEDPAVTVRHLTRIRDELARFITPVVTT